MIPDAKITIALILFFVVIFAVLYLFFWLITLLLHRRKTSSTIFHKKNLLKVKLLIWGLFILYFLYRFLSVAPGYTVIILVTTLVLGWSFWLNILAGISLKLDGKLRQGLWIEVQGKKGKLTHIGLRHLHIEKAPGSIQIIPNRKLIHEGFSLFPGPTEDLKIELTIEQKSLEIMGGTNAFLAKLAASPWASKTMEPHIDDTQNGNLTLVAWAFSEETKTRYRKYLTELIDISGP